MKVYRLNSTKIKAFPICGMPSKKKFRKKRSKPVERGHFCVWTEQIHVYPSLLHQTFCHDDPSESDQNPCLCHDPCRRLDGLRQSGRMPGPTQHGTGHAGSRRCFQKKEKKEQQGTVPSGSVRRFGQISRIGCFDRLFCFPVTGFGRRKSFSARAGTANRSPKIYLPTFGFFPKKTHLCVRFFKFNNFIIT
jgi:hypothetical protein